ncbi:Calretinin [Gossypium australe]|uniref:Calretinin n=1 Tax=Gossypium australe TaxID=47621 RepID=A0A5B6URD7_9ROSI|nr:Calretinin [Gossypium australe]
MAKLRHSRLQVKKLSTVTLVLLMLFMLTVVLLMLLGLGIFSLPINDDDSPPNDLTSYRCMASESFDLFQSGLTTTNEPSIQGLHGKLKQVLPNLPDTTSQGLPGPGNTSRGSAYQKFSSESPNETSFGTRTEKAGRLRSENNLLQLVLKHQRIVEELMEENLKLRQILMEDLKIPPSKLQASYSSKIKSPCSECLYCRRKQRRNR